MCFIDVINNAKSSVWDVVINAGPLADIPVRVPLPLLAKDLSTCRVRAEGVPQSKRAQIINVICNVFKPQLECSREPWDSPLILKC
jgi:hypothetical protein